MCNTVQYCSTCIDGKLLISIVTKTRRDKLGVLTHARRWRLGSLRRRRMQKFSAKSRHAYPFVGETTFITDVRNFFGTALQRPVRRRRQFLAAVTVFSSKFEISAECSKRADSGLPEVPEQKSNRDITGGTGLLPLGCHAGGSAVQCDCSAAAECTATEERSTLACFTSSRPSASHRQQPYTIRPM